MLSEHVSPVCHLFFDQLASSLALRESTTLGGTESGENLPAFVFQGNGMRKDYLVKVAETLVLSGIMFLASLIVSVLREISKDLSDIKVAIGEEKTRQASDHDDLEQLKAHVYATK